MSNAFAPVYDSYYGERLDHRVSAVEKWLRGRWEHANGLLAGRRARMVGFARKVNRVAIPEGVTSRDWADALRGRARREGLSDPYLAEVFALVRLVSERELGLRQFDVQLMGGYAMVRGMVAEMETGQGKTLTATLAASAAALGGFPTHVITVNEYLASRDAEWMRPIYEALGLTVGVALSTMSADERREMYTRDVVYCTNKQIAFDYLRDRIEVGMSMSNRRLRLEALYSDAPVRARLLLHGLYFGIVDEADSVLIDEAVTPLIISASSSNDSKQRVYEGALAFARRLQAGRDFRLHEEISAVEFTKTGNKALEDWSEATGGVWKSEVIREELVAQALRALHLYERDRQYLVSEGKIVIIDEFTGRTMADRSWQGGLHQMIELKEGCEMTGDKETLARISYQQFFRRYLNLAGMTGTASEVGREIRKVYGMIVVRIPPAQKIRRRVMRDHVYASAEEKWRAIVKRAAEVHAAGCPVLIGTRSVAASEYLSRMLRDENLEHQLLNARQDRKEAEIVAQAGEPRRITVATNMAGRGTDIKLPDEVIGLGGLHVIMTERHDSRRIDRQLFGRCGRQGDPGVAETFLSLEDELIEVNLPPRLTKGFARLVGNRGILHRLLMPLLFYGAQAIVERRNYVARCNVVKLDEQLGDMLAFSGRME